MIDLIQKATELSSKGLIVSVNVDTWDGILEPRTEWGDINIKLLPDDIISSFIALKKKTIDNLLSHSIPCADGRFVPYTVFEEWMSAHNESYLRFYQARASILSGYDIIRESIKSAVSVKYAESWKNNHPTDSLPPPSGTIYAVNLALSLFPTKEQFYELYKIERFFNQHSFLFMQSGIVNLNIDDGEKRSMAWKLIDELGSGNARILIGYLNSALRGKAMAYKLNCAFDGAKLFLTTDILGENILKDKVQQLYDLINLRTIQNTNREAFSALLQETKKLAIQFSSVSNLIGFLK